MVSQVDPFVGRYFSNNYVMNKILMMTDEEIEAMQAEIQKEKDTLPDDMQGPVLSGPPQGAVPQAEPEDNTVENAEEEESLTPGLDDEVSKSVVSINNRRR
jgi:hypothetical protein